MDQPPIRVTELACNLDDATGETIAAAVETLLRAGALDVWTIPIVMKHGRPGVTLCVLCEADAAVRMSRRMIELTGSFGVRRREWDRVVLARRHETIQTAFGALRIKVGSLDGQVVSVKPEYADAARAAESHGVSVARVIDAARGQAEAMFLPRKEVRP